MDLLDITTLIHNDMPVFPGDAPPRVTPLGDHARGDRWVTSRLELNSHTGTHLDAPLHLIEGGATVDSLDLNVLIGPAYVLDLLSVEETITARELEGANLPRDARRVLLKTRNGALWREPGFQTDFVALSGAGARWLVSRGVQLVALDYLSADRYQASDAPAHHALLGAGVIIVEGVRLEVIEPGWYQLICLPLRLQGADGAPVRAVLVRA